MDVLSLLERVGSTWGDHAAGLGVGRCPRPGGVGGGQRAQLRGKQGDARSFSVSAASWISKKVLRGKIIAIKSYLKKQEKH